MVTVLFILIASVAITIAIVRYIAWRNATEYEDSHVDREWVERHIDEVEAR